MSVFVCIVWVFFMEKYEEIKGLEAPGNYSGQFGSNNFSILLLGRPKPNMFIIPGFLNPWEPLFMDLNNKNTSKHIGQIWELKKKQTYDVCKYENLKL